MTEVELISFIGSEYFEWDLFYKAAQEHAMKEGHPPCFSVTSHCHIYYTL